MGISNGDCPRCTPHSMPSICRMSRCPSISRQSPQLAEQDDESLDTVCEIMGQAPPWAEGLLLRADGYECEFYKKD